MITPRSFGSLRSLPKSEILQVRFSPEDRARIELVAASVHLDPSTWVRQAVLLAVEDAEEAPRAFRRLPANARPAESDAP